MNFRMPFIASFELLDIHAAVAKEARRNPIKDAVQQHQDRRGLDPFFFFQAEDGIRDLTVTGVQTCALPISGENQVIIGTTEEVYILTGTFITMPDGTLDVYIRGLGVEETPISIDVAGNGNRDRKSVV